MKTRFLLDVKSEVNGEKVYLERVTDWKRRKNRRENGGKKKEVENAEKRRKV